MKILLSNFIQIFIQLNHKLKKAQILSINQIQKFIRLNGLRPKKNLNKVYNNYIKNYIKKLNFDLRNLNYENDLNNIKFLDNYIRDVRSSNFEKPAKIENTLKLKKLLN